MDHNSQRAMSRHDRGHLIATLLRRGDVRMSEVDFMNTVPRAVVFRIPRSAAGQAAGVARRTTLVAVEHTALWSYLAAAGYLCVAAAGRRRPDVLAAALGLHALHVAMPAVLFERGGVRVRTFAYVMP